MSKIVVAKDFFGFYFTSKENYYARIRNERQVKRLSDFEGFEEIKDWLIRYGFAKEEDIELIK